MSKKKCFHITAVMRQYLDLYLNAESEEQALELAGQVDGSAFTADEFASDWEIISAEEAPDEEGQDFDDLPLI